MATLVKKLNTTLINNKPVVIVPVKLWDKIRASSEEMREELEMLSSLNFKKNIAHARKGKKSYSDTEARKKLGL